MSAPRDHGGGLDAAIARWGGTRGDWLDLSTGINPVPYPVEGVPEGAWTALPDRAAALRLTEAARRFWEVPEGAMVTAAPGASALIAALPGLLGSAGRVDIPGPTYNEHAAAFAAAGWTAVEDGADVRVLVHPNNPDGRLWDDPATAPVTVIDESFCDTCPERSHVARTARPGTVVLKSFGKFWGLAGLRLGFVIAHPATLDPARLADRLGPWPVSGPALEIGARALEDLAWAQATRARLAADAAWLDGVMTARGARLAGGTPLFRLYDVGDAVAWHERLARGRVWSRVFPYSRGWLRLGLPAPEGRARLEAAL